MVMLPTVSCSSDSELARLGSPWSRTPPSWSPTQGHCSSCSKVNASKDHLDLNISAEVDGRRVPVKELLRNAARGQNIMVFKDGMRAKINDEWLSRYRTC